MYAEAVEIPARPAGEAREIKMFLETTRHYGQITGFSQHQGLIEQGQQIHLAFKGQVKADAPITQQQALSHCHAHQAIGRRPALMRRELPAQLAKMASQLGFIQLGKKLSRVGGE